MDKATRNTIERATQQVRRLLDGDFSSQLEGAFDILRSGVVAPKGGAHLSALQRSQRERIVGAIEHKRAFGMTAVEAVTDYVRDAAFTTLNRFVALKMLEARELVQECITKGEQCAGYREFCGMAPGIALLPDASGYRLYIESLFDEFSTEIKILFDRRDAASVLWPKRQTFESLLAILNAEDLSGVWGEDETIGWVYQFFNSGEERKKMRDESQAPRNSRELAVRNQFFTPRYVVQFLTDNTLGRLWLEMHGDETRLAKFCEYLVRSTDESISTRPRKDPRDLRILDPACGSGHFLLYSFDLLLMIYEEAWLAEGVTARSEVTGRTLRDEYPDLADLRRAAPRLIVEHNLYGVDIDPRCAQIAALALWLRAQRAWKELGIPAYERPRIHRTHIVVAEPMPGDAALVDDFAARLDPPLLGDLFKQMVAESRMAGELGTLLRVEDGIADGLHRAREQFVRQRQTTEFLPGMEPVIRQGVLDLSGIDDDSFFFEAESRIVEALHGFAENAIGAGSVQRRLFAGDAAQGIALIDVVRTRFDVVLMNPPFGSGSVGAKKEFEESYPRTKNDVFAAFVERGIQLLHPHGLLGAITSRGGFFLSSFQKWREEILLKQAPPVVFADLGYGVLDSAMVEVAAYCLEKGRKAEDKKTVFLSALEEFDDKKSMLREAIRSPEAARGHERFEINIVSFSVVPRSPFAYWVSDSFRNLFESREAFAAEGRITRQGLATANDFRWVRLWWERDLSTGDDAFPVPYAKGGAFSPFYSDLPLTIRWGRDGRWIKEWKAEQFRLGVFTANNSKCWNESLYFRPGLTWPLRSQRGLSVRPMPSGVIFGQKGSAAFVLDNDSNQLLAYSAIFSSAPCLTLVKMQMAFGAYDVGVIARTPVPSLRDAEVSSLAHLARRIWSLKRSLDASNEVSHAFTMPSLLRVTGNTLAARVVSWDERLGIVEAELSAVRQEIDKRCFDLYGIAENDRNPITNDQVGMADVSDETSGTAADTESDSDDEDDFKGGSDAITLAAELVSWAAGVAFGQFDLRVLVHERFFREDPEPFEPLPVCSPAMLSGDDGLPLANAPAGYPSNFPDNGILVEDAGHSLDLVAAVRVVFDAIFKERADAWWSDVQTLLDPKGHDLRTWLASSFFDYHLKRYSKSRRKAPMLWQLAIPSGRYSVWLNARRLSRDSFFQIQNDVIIPKLAHEERQLVNMAHNAGPNPSARDRKEITAQETFVEELRSFLNEIKRIAPLWNPTLDDGVALTMASLWRLVPQHKSWQKELRSKWSELTAGKYDWAHLAMHLWPERVVPKCMIDRSLAIPHDLEDVFWIEGDDGKWQRRPNPTRPVEELVRERTSTAVRAALKSLLEAPASNMNRGRQRDLRAASAVADGGAN